MNPVTHSSLGPFVLGTLLFSVFNLGCAHDSSQKQIDTSSTSQLETLEARSVSIEIQSDVSRWLFVGDSLTAGFGVEPERTFVARLQERLKREGWVDPITQETPLLKNAGVSGDTSAGTLRRIDWLLSDRADRVFLCIGANDGMRGQPIDALKHNLSKIAQRVQSRGAKLHLMKMFLPPNYGEEYTQRFANSFEEVASKENLSLFPFLLRGIAGVANLNQSDGIHPNADGHQKAADQLLDHLVSLGFVVKHIRTNQ